jgi:hypothetical protein
MNKLMIAAMCILLLLAYAVGISLLADGKTIGIGYLVIGAIWSFNLWIFTTRVIKT